jgi:hypothetical protein
MDALALLCNLHADGPTTLHRLRRGGCESLPRLVELEADALMAISGWELRTAERFLREAELLADRVGAELPERDALLVTEASDYDDDDFEFDDDDGDDDLDVDDDDEDEDEDDEEEEEEEEAEEDDFMDLDAAAAESVDALLERWRDLDRDAPPAPPIRERIEAPAALAPSLSLERACLEGVGPELVGALGRAGIATVGELATAPSLALAASTGLGFTRVERLRFLARRAAREGVLAAPVAPLPSGPGAGGPFA